MRRIALPLASLASPLLFYATNRFLQALSIELGQGFVGVVSRTVDSLVAAIEANPLSLDTSLSMLACSLVAALLPWLAYLTFKWGASGYRDGEEYGSAGWGTPKDIAPFMDRKDFSNNILLSSSVRIRLDKHRTFRYDRNKNVVVIGGSGSGKTYSMILPNLMQMHASYIITDSKGTLYTDTREMFRRNQYQIRLFDSICPENSMHYNPMAYVRNEDDILKLVNVFIENTSPEGAKGGDPFWEKSERLLLMAVVGYIYECFAPEDRHFSAIVDIVARCAASEDDEEFKSDVDLLFEAHKEQNPHSFACKQYDLFLLAAGKTKKSILISAAVRLAPFTVAKIRNLTSSDDMRFEEIGSEKVALYIVMSDTDNTYSFLVAMMLYQLFNVLTEHADRQPGGKLKVPVRLMLDEFANIGKLPNFQRLIATIRSRNIHALIILQSLNQLKAVYKDDAETIIDCCDTLVFLGGKAASTTKAVSEMIGKTTITTHSQNNSSGAQASFSKSRQTAARDLIEASEITRLPQTDCIVVITGLKPFRSRKFDTASHPYLKGEKRAQRRKKLKELKMRFRKKLEGFASRTQ